MDKNLLSEAVSFPSVTAIIASITVFIALIKYLSDFHFEKNKFRHKNLEIAQATLSSNSNKASLKQRFLTEQVFSLIYRFNFSYDEISVLLRYANPSKAFDLFVKGSPYLMLSKNMKSIVFNGNYWQLKLWRFKVYPRDILHIVRYFIFGFIGTYAFAPAIYVFDSGKWFVVPEIFSFLGLDGIFLFIISVVFGVVIWGLAFKAIRSVGKIRDAFELIEIGKSLK